MDKVNIPDKFAQFHDHWSPKIIGELNGQQVKLAKLQGEFIWHQHEEEDELFYVVKGQLKIEFKDRIEVINENEMIIVPKGVAHKPIADAEVWVLLFEPASTLNTGNITNERTKTILEKI